jgi:GNAT superfamily N-acetyltransferase
MIIYEVKTDKDKKDFLEVPLRIYKGDPFWVRPLDNDINQVFDPEKNGYFRHGEVIRWILKDEKGNLAGRVAAFINRLAAKEFDQPTGGMGFFECINDKASAFLLFDTCKKWLEERGMEAMDGPINFGEKDKWWGLIVDGFSEPTYTSNYNPAYYRAFFEDYGFKTYYQQYYYQIEVRKPLPPRFEALYTRITRNPDYRCEHIRKDKLQKYTADFHEIYNKAWGKHDGFKEMSLEQAGILVNSIKPIMDEELIWFAYYKNEPVGFFVMLPEINGIIKHMNGKLDLPGKLRFLWYKWTGKCRKMFGVVFGVTPEFQGKGMESLMIVSAARKLQNLNRYDVMEMTWIGDFNPKMIHLVESLGATRAKTYITYRKLFDESKPFQRAPLIS